MTPTERATKVADAVEQLPDALAAALAPALAADSLAAWEAVEKLGATVHRQARLLAGKSKGG